MKKLLSMSNGFGKIIETLLIGNLKKEQISAKLSTTFPVH